MSAISAPEHWLSKYNRREEPALPWTPTLNPHYPARTLQHVLEHVSENMRWRLLPSIVDHIGAQSTLAHLDWASILQAIWWQANVGRSGVERSPSWTLEVWQDLLFDLSLETPSHLADFIVQWMKADPLVGAWMRREVQVSRATADLGGWLADYIYTIFRVLSGQSKEDIRFAAVGNKLYASLLRLLEVSISDATEHVSSNAEKDGNILEHLCWHALESGFGSYALSLVWLACNRTLEWQPDASTSTGSRSSTDRQHPRTCNIKKDIIEALYSTCVTASAAEHGEWKVTATEHRLPMAVEWQSILPASVAEHGEVQEATAKFFLDEPDPNRQGRPRLDIVVTFADRSMCRYHPKADLIWNTDPQPTVAMTHRYNYAMRRRK